MLAPAQDLPNRRPVWQTLSELYLDTDPSPGTLLGAARTLASSPYSMEELRLILMHEVHPVCVANRLSVAGEWSAFGVAWLETRIVERRGNAVLDRVRWMLSRQLVRTRAAGLLARVEALRRARPGRRAF